MRLELKFLVAPTVVPAVHVPHVCALLCLYFSLAPSPSEYSGENLGAVDGRSRFLGPEMPPLSCMVLYDPAIWPERI